MVSLAPRSTTIMLVAIAEGLRTNVQRVVPRVPLEPSNCPYVSTVQPRRGTEGQMPLGQTPSKPPIPQPDGVHQVDGDGAFLSTVAGKTIKCPLSPTALRSAQLAVSRNKFSSASTVRPS